MLLQWISKTVGKGRRAVFGTLAVPHDDAAMVEVQVLHPEPESFGQAKAASVKEVRNEGVRACVHGGKEAAGFRLREDRWEALRAVGSLDGPNVAQGLVKDVVVEKDEGVEGLVLCGRRHVALDGEVIEEGPHLVCPQVARVRGIVEADVPDDPPAVAFFRVPAVLAAPARGVNPVEER